MGTRPPDNRKKRVKKGNKRTFHLKTLKSWLAALILKETYMLLLRKKGGKGIQYYLCGGTERR
jgi:uncharacterized protein YbaP (TraB family)